MLKDKYSFNTIFVVVNHLSKQLIITPYYKTITTKDMAYIYIINVYYHKGALELIVLDKGL